MELVVHQLNNEAWSIATNSLPLDGVRGITERELLFIIFKIFKWIPPRLEG
jgi:hypothetical protein